MGVKGEGRCYRGIMGLLWGAMRTLWACYGGVVGVLGRCYCAVIGCYEGLWQCYLGGLTLSAVLGPKVPKKSFEGSENIFLRFGSNLDQNSILM